jgi:DNA helicase II / ATP-dependent DNA helicase PcrA
VSEVPASPAVIAALKGHRPTREQWNAIAHPLEPVHLIAGAGSGKTAIMAARMAWTIESRGYAPSQILGLTFTNKASEELEDRVRRALEAMDYAAGDVTVQTYHAFAAAIVRDHGLLVGVEADAGLLTEAQQWQLVSSCLDDLPAFEAIELRSVAGLVRATLRLSSSLADHIVGISDVEAAADRILASAETTEEVRITAAKRKELCRAVAAYKVAKQSRGRIDFGDQVSKAVEILEGSPEIAAQYRDRWPVVLLDEYQDTNVAQRRLIKALVGEGAAVTAVGDARQAIYAFRGATMYNLIGFAGHFPRRQDGRHEPISLSENFRSGARILEVANAVVGRIPDERRPGAPLRAFGPNGAGKVSLGLFSDERAESRWIASECEQLHGFPTAPGRLPVRWRDIAILVRRRVSMDAIIESFEEHDIPLEVVGLGGLLKTPEVTEIVAWMRCLETKPSANRWLARVVMGPRWRIHPRDLALCARWAADQNRDLKMRLAGGDEERARDMEPGDVGFALIESLDHIDAIEGLGPEARKRLSAFADRLNGLRRKISAPLLELVQEVIRQTGISDALEASSSRAAPSATQNVANFLDHVAAFAPVEGETTLRSFLAYLDAAEDAEETLDATQPAEQDSVKLMTIHSAKGLEFECVFVPSVAASTNSKGDFVYSIFPNERASNPLTSYTELPYEVREDGAHLPRWTGKLKDFSIEVKERVREDERRLLYVALTRAKQHLLVTAAWWYGRDKRAKGPSLFWSELQELEKEGLLEVFRRDDQPQDNPVIDTLESKRKWPPDPRVGALDELFPEGSGNAAEAIVESRVTFEELMSRRPLEHRAEVERLAADHDSELSALAAAARPPEKEASLPEMVSATDFVRLKAGDMDPIELVRPVPDRPTAARRIGVGIHRIIEEMGRDGVERELPSPFPEESELDEPAGADGEAVMPAALEHYGKLGYGNRTLARLPSGDPMIELPFALRRGETVVRGRIDAVYETEDGGLEIVDFKTGRRFSATEEDQLELYARALEANGLLPAGRPVTLTYAFLDGGEPLSRRWVPDRGDAPGSPREQQKGLGTE